MKIAILTQPLTNNYGGFLQNFALQEVLRRKGHAVITLNVLRPISKMQLSTHWFLSCVKRFVQKYLLHDSNIIYINAYKQTNWGNIPQRFQQRFIDEHIRVEMLGPLALTYDNDKYDAYIVGSDQVWRPCFSSGLLPTYYLDFVKNEKAKRIAYAASFGVDNWETDEITTQVVASLAKKFDAISVREQSGIKLCENYLGVDAIHVLDPTMLLDADDYRELYGKHSTHKEIATKYIATYVLDNDSRVQDIIEKVAKRMGLPIKRLGDVSRNGFDSIESWLEGIDKATYIITDSFHGSVFSLIFEKQFVAIGNKSRGMSRFKSLFSLLNINDRLVSSYDETIASFNHEIDYNKINGLIAKERVVSDIYLSKYLN